MKTKYLTTFLLLLILTVLSACNETGQTGTDKTTPARLVVPTPEAGKAVLTGQVVSAKSGQPFTDTPVRLAQIYRQGTEGAFVLDLSHSPSTISNAAGQFVILGVDPAEYLVVVGKPEDNNYKIYSGKDGKPITYNLAAGKVTDLGKIAVDYTP